MRVDTTEPADGQNNLNSSRLWERNYLFGTSIVYAATTKEDASFLCDYYLPLLDETHLSECRARRKQRQRSEECVESLADERLSNELLVIFGPEMSAHDAVITLQRLLDRIRESGLLVGRLDNNEYAVELLDGSWAYETDRV